MLISSVSHVSYPDRQSSQNLPTLTYIKDGDDIDSLKDYIKYI